MIYLAFLNSAVEIYTRNVVLQCLCLLCSAHRVCVFASTAPYIKNEALALTTILIYLLFFFVFFYYCYTSCKKADVFYTKDSNNYEKAKDNKLGNGKYNYFFQQKLFYYLCNVFSSLVLSCHTE